MKHTVHAGLSIAAPVQKGKENELRALLKHATIHHKLPFQKANTVLFVSIAVIPEQKYHGEILPATLLLLTSYHGPFKEHLSELLSTCGPGLEELFFNCQDYPHQKSGTALKNYLLKHRHQSTFYSGMHGITLHDVEREKNLRKEIKLFVNEAQKTNAFNGLNAADIRSSIQDHIRTKGKQFEWAAKPFKRKFADWFAFNRKVLLLGLYVLAAIAIITLAVITKNIILIVIAVVIILLIPAFFIGIFVIESAEQAVAERPSDDKMRIIGATQGNPVVNEMTAAGPIKKGILRRIIFVAVLRVVSMASTLIKIPTICTARWVAIDKGKRLVFISNFTNKSDSYVRDFIDSESSAKGINLMFGHGEGYPKTKMLRREGNLKDPDGFMNVLHQNQHPTEFWYAPSRNLTVDIIKNNRQIRNGLFKDPKDIQQWLNLL
jgi:hypothetical protein